MGSGSAFSMDEYESLMATSDVELLKKAWRNEKSAPEILEFQISLVQRSREQIQLMVYIFDFPFHLNPNFFFATFSVIFELALILLPITMILV